MSGNSLNPKDANNENKNIDSIESFMNKLEEKNDILNDLSTIITEPSLQSPEIKASIEERKKTENQKYEQKIIFDININSIDDLLEILISKSYDFFILEPKENFVKVSFRKNGVEIEGKYIKFPIYSNILIKTKSICKLNLEVSNIEQKGQSEYKLKDKNLKILRKIVPQENGEKVFVKASIIEEKTENKVKKQNIDIKKTFSFLAAIFVVALIISSAFLTFVIINAQTIDDVRFFYQLGISLSDINNFLLKLTNVTFSLLIFIETIFLAIFIFKALITKKEFKKQKTKYTILSIFFLIVSFTTLSIWMIMDKKIRNLPNWREEIYGDIQMIDNDKLVSGKFEKIDSIITDSTNLIGPINIKYDVSRFVKKQAKKGFQITKFYWIFNGAEKQETLNGELIKLFDEVGVHNVKLIAEGTDLDGKIKQMEIPNMPAVNIKSIVKIEETKMPNGGKAIVFDASDLKNMGELQWYMEDDLSKPTFIGNIFRPAKIFFDKSIVGLYIKTEGRTDKSFDKIFVVYGDNPNDIKGVIKYEQDINDPLKYTLRIEDLKLDSQNGFIKEFRWEIEGDIITKQADISDLSKSSEISYIFKKFGKNKIQVTIIDSAGKTKTLDEVVNISKKMSIKNKLEILSDGENIDYKYNDLSNEYNILSLGVPSKLTLNATNVKTDDAIYILKNVDWDTNGDGKIDKNGKSIDMDINTPGEYNIQVEYTFFRINKKDDEIKIQERININALEKEVNLSLKINQDSEYAPAKVSFDASNSKVKGQNIIKFAFDYGDGSPIDIRDAINPGHIYTKDGDFTVKLTVTTDAGKSYSIEKHVIVKPAQQKAKISLSMKEAPVGQTISFESKDSIGQINNYSWDFGDGEISSEANPSHAYKKPGKYKVKLTLLFANGNELSDEAEINIVE